MSNGTNEGQRILNRAVSVITCILKNLYCKEIEFACFLQFIKNLIIQQSHSKKTEVQEQSRDIYHRYHGVDGYRSMTPYLKRAGHSYRTATIHEYMNTQMGLRSIVRPKKLWIKLDKPHKIFENKLKQDFHADKPNQKWYIDFTYLFLKNGDVCYRCTIIDLYDRSVAADITDCHITCDPHTTESIGIPTPGKRRSDIVYIK